MFSNRFSGLPGPEQPKTFFFIFVFFLGGGIIFFRFSVFLLLGDLVAHGFLGVRKLKVFEHLISKRVKLTLGHPDDIVRARLGLRLNTSQ